MDVFGVLFLFGPGASGLGPGVWGFEGDLWVWFPGSRFRVLPFRV